MRIARVLAVAVPIALAARPLGGPAPPVGRPAPHEAHAVDLDLRHAGGVRADTGFATRAERARLARWQAGDLPAPRPPMRILGDGLRRVGDVAILEASDAEATQEGRQFGMSYDNLAAVSTRFIAAFGDHYDQVAMFLQFTDKYSPAALAYEMPVKNDVKGLGLDLYDSSGHFGSAGRVRAVLNMKRITAYGRDAADQPGNFLYPVWAQEAAHRWLMYFRMPGDTDAEKEILLGRQKAHWAPMVDTGGSVMDGYTWRDNGDGTFTPTERSKRYGPADQYAMGLRRAEDTPDFFRLVDVKDEDGRDVPQAGPVGIGRHYTATRVPVRMADLIEAQGPREPATDATAQDLRMGVVLVVPQGSSAEDAVGEAYRIDRTRALWDGFYNDAGGGRGHVCTQLRRPCRGGAFVFGTPTLIETSGDGDGVVAPGEGFRLLLPVIATGSEAAATTVRLTAEDPAVVALDVRSVPLPGLDPGASAVAAFSGTLAWGAPCGAALRFEVEPDGALGPSGDTLTLIAGLARGVRDDLEGDVSGWRVDPDHTDTATQGAWQLGAPAREMAFDFVLQPGAAWSGSHAFVTGAAPGAEPGLNDVDEGFTTVESPAFALAGLPGEPHLRYRGYFVSADFFNDMLIPGAGDALHVFASLDGGPWKEIDRMTGLGLGWQERLVRLADHVDLAGASSVRFRFVAEDTGVVQNVVEAVIDDIEVVGEVARCSEAAPPPPPVEPGGDAGVPGEGGGDGGGCGCRTGPLAVGRAGAAVRGIVASSALGLLVWARSRRRRP